MKMRRINLWSSVLALAAAFSLILEADAGTKYLKPKEKVSSETYPALESEPLALGQPDELQPLPEVDDSSAQARALEERLRALEYRSGLRSRAQAPAQAPAPRVAPSTDFERVPADKVQMITARLKIVEQILSESGRAYDYRTKTTRELQGILESIRAKKEFSPAPERVLGE